MNIIYATSMYDARDERRGSGTYYHMSQEMERQGHAVQYVGPFKVRSSAFTRVLKRVTKVSRRRYLTYLDPWECEAKGHALTQQIQSMSADVLITNDFGLAGFVETNLPVVIYTDAMLPFHFARDNPPESRTATVPNILAPLFQRTIRRGMEQARLCVFPATWSAEEAEKYGIPKSKIATIPFGANIEDPGRGTALATSLSAEPEAPVNLLFVGKEWKRKGGQAAVDIVGELHQRGINAHLHVVGTTPRVGLPYVHEYGLLDKTNPDEKALLQQLFATSHLFLLPSRSEGFGIVVLEAAAYGLPVLAYGVEGLLDAVADGKSGRLIDLNSPVTAFVDVVERWVHDPVQYAAMAESARDFFEENGNWTQTIQRFIAEIQQHI